MIGAIAGVIVGSVDDWDNIKTKDFPLFSDRNIFTDGSVLTIALANTIHAGTPHVQNLRVFYRWSPHHGFRGSFYRWA